MLVSLTSVTGGRAARGLLLPVFQAITARGGLTFCVSNRGSSWALNWVSYRCADAAAGGRETAPSSAGIACGRHKAACSYPIAARKAFGLINGRALALGHGHGRASMAGSGPGHAGNGISEEA